MAIKLEKTLVVRNLIKNYKLAGHIEKAIGKGEIAWKADFQPKVGDSGFHPSGHCTPSPLQLYNYATSVGSGKAPSISLRKSFAVGHFWHAYLQHIVVEELEFASWDDIERSGKTVWGDLDNPEPFHWATGSGDIAPCDIPGHGKYLIDIKTMKGVDFNQQGLPNWCAKKYECQVNIYMDWFDLDQCIIFCVQKESPHDFREVTLKKNQPLIDAIYSKWKLVSRCLTKNIPPDEDYDIELPYEQ